MRRVDKRPGEKLSDASTGPAAPASTALLIATRSVPCVGHIERGSMRVGDEAEIDQNAAGHEVHRDAMLRRRGC